MPTPPPDAKTSRPAAAWERILYNQLARRLRAAMLGRPHTVVVDVPYRREDHTAS